MAERAPHDAEPKWGSRACIVEAIKALDQNGSCIVALLIAIRISLHRSIALDREGKIDTKPAQISARKDLTNSRSSFDAWNRFHPSNSTLNA